MTTDDAPRQGLYGTNLFGEPVDHDPTATTVWGRSDMVTFPFSVLDATKGEWMSRKSAWLSIGIKSEVGRGDGLLSSPKGYGAKVTKDADGNLVYEEGGISSGTSVFDPVLAEIAYKWHTPPDGAVVLDPFAGGSVRGIVAGEVGREYHGVELRAEQVAANREQADAIRPPVMPTWYCGDSAHVLQDDAFMDGRQADLVFSCPPYYDLERYAPDDPRDISNMSYPDFLDTYSSIITNACLRLKSDRFAVWVVGEVRDKRTGEYRGFVPDTIDAFRDAGMKYYNHAILTTSIGNLMVIGSNPFNRTRKLAKRHQDVLVFVKGDERRAAAYARGEST